MRVKEFLENRVEEFLIFSAYLLFVPLLAIVALLDRIVEKYGD